MVAGPCCDKLQGAPSSTRHTKMSRVLHPRIFERRGCMAVRGPQARTVISEGLTKLLL